MTAFGEYGRLSEAEWKAEIERLRKELHQAKTQWFEERKRARESEAELERLRGYLAAAQAQVEEMEAELELSQADPEDEP